MGKPLNEIINDKKALSLIANNLLPKRFAIESKTGLNESGDAIIRLRSNNDHIALVLPKDNNGILLNYIEGDKRFPQPVTFELIDLIRNLGYGPEVNTEIKNIGVIAVL